MEEASSRSSRIFRFHISRWEGVSLLERDSRRSSCLFMVSSVCIVLLVAQWGSIIYFCISKNRKWHPIGKTLIEHTRTLTIHPVK